jgi:ribose-phosphate pyrophosphokinase
LAQRLGGDLICLAKTRRGDRDVTIETPRVDLRQRAAVIVDDVAASGGTLERALAAVRRDGAEPIDVAVAHALMTQAETERLKQAGARRIVSTDSVAHPTNAAHLAPMLAAAVKEMIQT